MRPPRDPGGRPPLGIALSAASAAGVVAGAAMFLAAVLYTTFATPLEPLLPAKNVAATWMGVDALIGDSTAIAVGILTHIVASACWGLVFGLVGGGRTRLGPSLALGLAVGIVAWAVMTWVALPAVNSVMAERVDVLPAWWWFTLHLLFGLGLGLFAPLFARPRLDQRHATTRRAATA